MNEAKKFLIDANQLVDDIENHMWDWDSVDGIESSTVLKQVITDIKMMPNAIVPCSRCRHYNSGDGYCRLLHHWGVNMSPNDFCSKGEPIRREDEDESNG